MTDSIELHAPDGVVIQAPADGWRENDPDAPLHQSHVWRWRQHRFRTDWRCRVPFYFRMLVFILLLVWAVALALGFA